jgi:protein-L-isoaspartate O-methyltransferase
MAQEAAARTGINTEDIDPQLTGRARARLAWAGYQPAVVTGDGRDGYPPQRAV